MIVPRHPEGLGDAMVLHRRLKHHAVGELIDHGALDLLPWRLARRKLETALVLQGKATLRQFLLRDQNVGCARVKIDADAVAGSQQREAAVGGRFSRSVRFR
jgi:hypothetical protein